MTYIFAVRHTTESVGKGDRSNGWHTYRHILHWNDSVQWQ